jgi:hypothetical protein
LTKNHQINLQTLPLAWCAYTKRQSQTKHRTVCHQKQFFELESQLFNPIGVRRSEILRKSLRPLYQPNIEIMGFDKERSRGSIDFFRAASPRLKPKQPEFQSPESRGAEHQTNRG